MLCLPSGALGLITQRPKFELTCTPWLVNVSFVFSTDTSSYLQNLKCSCGPHIGPTLAFYTLDWVGRAIHISHRLRLNCSERPFSHFSGHRGLSVYLSGLEWESTEKTVPSLLLDKIAKKSICTFRVT